MRRSSSVSRLPVGPRNSRLPRPSSLDRRSTTNATGCKTPSLRERSLERGRSIRTPNAFTIRTPNAFSGKNKQNIEHAYKRVLEYFNDNPSTFDPNIVNEKNLRPPSLPTYIYIMNAFLSDISCQYVGRPKKIVLTPQNYKEQLIPILKTLQYPEPVTQGQLRLVNSMSGFAAVINMFHWFVQLSSFCKVEGSSPINLEVAVRYFSTIIYDTENWMEDGSMDRLDNAIEQFRPEIDIAIGLDINEFEKAKMEHSKNEEELESLNRKILVREETVESIRIEISKKMKYINKVRNARNEGESNQQYQMDEASKIKHKKQILEQKMAEARKYNIQLKEVIKNQPYSKIQFKQLKQERENEEKQLNLRKKTIEEQEKINDELDLNMSKQIDKIEEFVHQWNNSLIRINMLQPESKSLLIRKNGFDDPNFLLEIKKNIEQSRNLKSKFNSYFVELQQKVNLEQAENNNMVVKNNEISIFKDELIHKLSEIKNILRANEIQARQSIEDIQSQISSLEEKIKQQKIDNNRFQQDDEYQVHLSESIEKCRNEIKDYCNKMVLHMVDFQKEMTNKVKEHDRMRILTIEAVKNANSRMLERAKKNINKLKLSIDKDN